MEIIELAQKLLEKLEEDQWWFDKNDFDKEPSKYLLLIALRNFLP